MSTDENTPEAAGPGEGERIAKVLSRAGVSSRRDAERLILEGRVTVNGQTVTSPATNVTEKDRLAVDGAEVGAPEATRLWLYHKPAGLVTTESDEEGRPTVFDSLPDDMPRVMSIGRLDLTSEGLLLLTNDGEVKRRLELPSTGWSRRYRVRIHGTPTNDQLQPLRDGVTVEDMDYQPMEVSIDRQQGSNAWLSITLREGKNREIRRVMEHLGFTVNRLIRVSYGPFQLGELPVGDVEEVRPKIVRDQLGLSAPRPQVSRARKGAATDEALPPEEAAPDRPERERLSTARPAGATVKRELKPRTPAARKAGAPSSEGRGPKPARKPSLPGAFARPRTWMRSDDPREASEESPREERRPHEGKPRSSGYKSHGRPPREGAEERPRSAGFRSHSDRDARPSRGTGGDRERPARFEGDRGPRRHGDGDRPYKPRREGDPDRPRSPRPPREGGGERAYAPRDGQGDRPYKPRPPREAGSQDRPHRAYKPRPEGSEDRPARYGRKPEGEDRRPPRREGDDSRPSRGFKSSRPPREGGDDRSSKPYSPRPSREGGPRPPREGGSDRPPRSYKPREGGEDSRGFKSGRPPREGGSDRPPRSFGERTDSARPPRKGPPREGGFKGRPSGGKPPRKG